MSISLNLKKEKGEPRKKREKLNKYSNTIMNRRTQKANNTIMRNKSKVCRVMTE